MGYVKDQVSSQKMMQELKQQICDVLVWQKVDFSWLYAVTQGIRIGG